MRTEPPEAGTWRNLLPCLTVQGFLERRSPWDEKASSSTGDQNWQGHRRKRTVQWDEGSGSTCVGCVAQEGFKQG